MAQGRKAENEPVHSSQSEEEEEEGSSEEEEEGFDSDSEDEAAQPQPPAKTNPSSAPAASKKPLSVAKSTPAPAAAAAAKSSSSEESESDSPPVSSRKADPNIKPIASKPMDEPLPTKKPRSKPKPKPSSEPTTSPPPAKSAKRPAAANLEVKVSSSPKRAKKKASSSTPANNGESEKKPATSEDSKKLLFQRLWSEGDEIVILKGMLDFAAKKGHDPNEDMNAFHDFIKKSLHVDVSRAQLVNKVGRLKKKYKNRASKGKVVTFTKEHDRKSYDLSNKIWGNNNGKTADVEIPPKPNGNARKNPRESKVAVTPNEETLKINGLSSPRGFKHVPNIEADNNGALAEALAGVGVTLQSARISRGSLEDEIVKDGLDLIKGPKRVELEEKWKRLHMEEVELFLKRVELIGEQTKLVLEALRSG